MSGSMATETATATCPTSCPGPGDTEDMVACCSVGCSESQEYSCVRWGPSPPPLQVLLLPLLPPPAHPGGGPPAGGGARPGHRLLVLHPLLHRQAQGLEGHGPPQAQVVDICLMAGGNRIASRISAFYGSF